MARIRCSGGIVLDRGQRAWLVEGSGEEVRDWRRFAAAPVVVGPPDPPARDVERARREARRLVVAGGPLVAAAGVDLGGGFRSARLDGGGESRRDAVLAALEVLGVDQASRIGEQAAVLVALFGERATRRVGAAAREVMASGNLSSLRLAVAASDLLGPEQLEDVLRWGLALPAGVDPVPQGSTDLLAERLGAAFGSFPPRRRLALIRSLWDDVVAWQRSAHARARARRRRFSQARLDGWQRQIAHQDEAWWRAAARPQLGDRPSATAMLMWAPGPPEWSGALERAFQEAISATALLRTAMATEEGPVETAVLRHLDQLAYAATAHLRHVPDRVEALRSLEPRGSAASDRAAAVAAATVLATDPQTAARVVEVGGVRVDRDHLGASLARSLSDACELSQAVLRWAIELYRTLSEVPFDVRQTPAVAEWRAVAGYSRVRDPSLWSHRDVGPADRLSLAERLAAEPAEPVTTELLDDGLWVADLADAIAQWYGHDQAAIAWFGLDGIDVDPPLEPPDARLPLAESLPLAVAGAAQLVSLGAAPPARPASWGALVESLVAAAEALGLADEFPVAPEVTEWSGRELPGTGLTVEVARTARQLAEWGNYMGNCIATYAEDAGEGYALVALRDPASRLVVNMAIARAGTRWRIDQALARFNQPLDDELEHAIRRWVNRLKGASVSPPRPVRAAAPIRRPRRRAAGRRPPARERLVGAAAQLGDAVGDLRTAPELARVTSVIRPIASALGWSEDDEDWLGLFVTVARPRRPGPLARATADALTRGCDLAELWRATGFRPLAAAVSGMEAGVVDLRRLADPTVPRSLRLALHEPAVWRARAVDLAGHRIRGALGELLRWGDPALDEAVRARPDVGFLTAAVLATTAAPPGERPLTPVPVAADGTVPGRPRSSVADPAGPWEQARQGAAELGALPPQVDRALADAPGGRLLVPSAWTAPRGWTALWARASRVSKEAARG